MTDRRFDDNPELDAYTGSEVIPAQSIEGGTDPATSDPVAAGDDVKITFAAIAPWKFGNPTPATGPINEAKGTAIASAATTNIGAATGNLVHITGTTTITAFDTVQAGTGRTLVFDGALTLTHDAGSLILPTGANIVTAAGDVAMFRSEGSGNWRCVGYMRADGSALTGSGAVSSVNAATGAVQVLSCIAIAFSDETTAITSGTGKAKFINPSSKVFNVVDVAASLSTAQATNGAGGIFTIDINEAGTSILSTKLTIDNTEKVGGSNASAGSATPAVISDASIAAFAEISIDVDQVGDGTAKGGKVYLIGYWTS